MRGEGKNSLQTKNRSFKREFRTFRNWLLLFFNVCLAESKNREELGEALQHRFPLVELEILLGGKLNRKEGRGDEMGASLMGAVKKKNNDHIHPSNDFQS